jgi:phosphoribosylformylglycinamidine synthase
VRGGLLASAHDCAEGGLLVALAECVITGGRGAKVALPAATAVAPGALFGEDPSRVVVSCEPGKVAQVRALAEQYGVPCVALGSVGGGALAVDGVLSATVAELAARHAGALRDVVGD